MNLSKKTGTSVLVLTLKLLFLTLVGTGSTQVFALPTDSQQSINVQADDQVIFDIARNTQTWSGEVIMQQGSMRIAADKIVIHSDGKKTTRIVATGHPAQFSQTPSVGQQPIEAKAFKLEYDVEGKTLHLIENATIVQQGASLSGNRIDYDVNKALVKADGSTTLGEQGRVRMVIPPQVKDGE